MQMVDGMKEWYIQLNSVFWIEKTTVKDTSTRGITEEEGDEIVIDIELVWPKIKIVINQTRRIRGTA